MLHPSKKKTISARRPRRRRPNFYPPFHSASKLRPRRTGLKFQRRLRQFRFYRLAIMPKITGRKLCFDCW